jgi:hypothetical protein
LPAGCSTHANACQTDQAAGWAKQIWRARLQLFCTFSFSLFPVSDSKKAGSDRDGDGSSLLERERRFKDGASSEMSISGKRRRMTTEIKQEDREAWLDSAVTGTT